MMIASAADRSIESLIKNVCMTAWRRKFFFLASFVSCFCLFMYWVLGRPLQYEGTTVLITGQSVPVPAQEPTRKEGDTPLALYMRIAESDEVIKAAAMDIGLGPSTALPSEPTQPSIFFRLRRELFPDAFEAVMPADPIAAKIGRIRAGLIIRSEQNSGVMRISYRDTNPDVAARFANALASRFIQKQTQLATRAGAADFFQDQRRRFEQEAETAAKALQAFSARTNLFSIKEQLDLLLKRRDVMTLSIASARGVVAQRTAERQVLADELRKLMAVARSSYVAPLVDSLIGSRSDLRVTEDRTVDPPALLMRVYQETLNSLFRAQADLMAADSLQKQQSEESMGVTRELTALLASKEEFNRLSADVDRATQNLEFYSKKMVEEQINAQLSRAQFSPVRVLQQAILSAQPVSPNYRLMSIIAVALSGLGSFLLTNVAPYRRSPPKGMGTTGRDVSVAQKPSTGRYNVQQIASGHEPCHADPTA